MPSNQQTKVDNSNRKEFYCAVYPMQLDNTEQLIDIRDFHDEIIAIDCCGWHYAKKFHRPIIMIETTTSLKNYHIPQNHYSYLIDDSNDLLKWPDIPHKEKTVILLDRSPLLKYLTLVELKKILSDIAKKYQPYKLLIRGHLQYIDDCRMVDRLLNWLDICQLPGYVTAKFDYDAECMAYTIYFKKHQ